MEGLGASDLRSSLVRAAQYVRMSTEFQKYSILNQKAAIERYAEVHGMKVVASYVDEARSGLNIRRRAGLRRLIEDVQAGRADFEVLLVYDVSRWGRFQDADEGAYYEYLCKKAGVRVIYCAEVFGNDGNLLESVLKSLKRAMAAEFSRELSTKVKAGQARLAKQGFHFGSLPAAGFRRQVVGSNGELKAILEPGQFKSLHTDHVILVPGPPEEVELVNRIFRHFVKDGLWEIEIVRLLNAEGLVNARGQPWTYNMVHGILKNEKCIGVNFYNRTNQLMGRVRKANPEAEWIRSPRRFEAIVPGRVFAQAQAILNRRKKANFETSKLISDLEALYRREGRITYKVLSRDKEAPCGSVYQKRFGSIYDAYGEVGAPLPKNFEYIAIHKRLRTEILQRFAALGYSVRPHKRASFRVDGAWMFNLKIARCRIMPKGREWLLRSRWKVAPDVTVVARMEPGGKSIKDFVFVPPERASAFIRLPERSDWHDPYRADDLSPLFAFRPPARIDVYRPDEAADGLVL